MRSSHPLASQGLTICLILSFQHLVYSSNCSATPLIIPITNNTIRNGIISYGGGVILGGQKFSLRVIDSDISSFFGIPVPCVGATDSRGCASSPVGGNISEVLRGGFYDPKDSTTYKGPLTLKDINLSAVDTNVFVNNTYGTDTATLGDTQIPIFPFKLSAEDAETNWGELGLGPNSYALSALESMGRIPSQVWGFFGGWTGLTADTIQNGGTVLGGYDKARVGGAFQEYDMTHDSRGCYLRVTITDIRVKQSNGLSDTIFTDGLALDACISPSYEVMSLPSSVVSNLGSLLGADLSVRTFGYYLYGFTVSSNVSTDFSLVFTLNHGQQIEVPNHQLIQPNVQVTSTGYSILNESTERTIRINSLQNVNKNDNSQLGWPFLSGAYLLIDHQQDKFSIAPAVNSVVSSTSLVPVTRTVCDTATSTPSTTKPTSTGSETSSASPQVFANHHKSSNIIPIVVGVVSGVVVTALLIITILMLHRKRNIAVSGPVELQGLDTYRTHETDGREILRQKNGFSNQTWMPLQSPRELPVEHYSRDEHPHQQQIYEL